MVFESVVGPIWSLHDLFQGRFSPFHSGRRWPWLRHVITDVVALCQFLLILPLPCRRHLSQLDTILSQN